MEQQSKRITHYGNHKTPKYVNKYRSLYQRKTELIQLDHKTPEVHEEIKVINQEMTKLLNLI